MFEILYKDPATIARYRCAPLVEERKLPQKWLIDSASTREASGKWARPRTIRAWSEPSFTRKGGHIACTEPTATTNRLAGYREKTA